MQTTKQTKSLKRLFTMVALVLMAAISNPIFSQNNIGINTTTPHSSAALDVESTSQGMLIPRMNATQRGLIATPATGLLVYQTDAPTGFYFYDGSNWTLLGATGPQGQQGIAGVAGTDATISIGAIGSPSANGATITSGVLSLTPADSTNGGIVTNGAQIFAGNKTFNGTATANSFVMTGGNSSQYLMADGSTSFAPAPEPLNGYPFMPIQNATSTLVSGTKSYWYTVLLNRDITINGIQLYLSGGADPMRCGIYRGYLKPAVSGVITLVGQTTNTAVSSGLPYIRKPITPISGQSLTFAAGEYMTIAFHSSGTTSVYYQSSPLSLLNADLMYSSIANYVATGFPSFLTQTSVSSGISSKICFELY